MLPFRGSSSEVGSSRPAVSLRLRSSEHAHGESSGSHATPTLGSMVVNG